MPADVVAAFAAVAGPDPARAIAAVVARVAQARGTDTTLIYNGNPVPPDPAVWAMDVEPRFLEDLGPWLPGMVREVLVGPAQRHRAGVHHTDPAVARVIASMALEAHDPNEVVVGDPSVGGGAFLLATADILASEASTSSIVSRLHGVDVDPLAVAVTRAALELWAGERVDGRRIRVADFLDPLPFGGTTVDVVLGNPPFLGQLKGATARTVGRTGAVRRRWADVGGYVDESALFLLAGLEVVGSSGTVALIQPVSMLSARDAGPVRSRVVAAGQIRGFWFDGMRAFGADVDTCAVVVRKDDEVGPIRRLTGVTGTARKDHPPITSGNTWAGLIADLTGVPVLDRPERAVRLGDVARCTAGFRDEFYGLRDAVYEDPDGSVRLVTSGLIDPLHCSWGQRPCRYDRRRWDAPAVDLDRVDAGIAEWVHQRLRPKLVVASQTPTLEVAVDIEGSFVPCTPVVSVEPTPAGPSLWHLAAALSSPQASAWLAAVAAGSALSRDALRVSASRLAELPLPRSGRSWDAAAAAAQVAHCDANYDRIRSLGHAAGEAYGGLHDDLFAWWTDRLRRSCRRAA